MEKEKSKVSICMPTYLHPEYVNRLLESVFIQDLTDFEVIISDNSPDNSVKNIVDQYPQGKIHYYQNIPQLPITENWNNAIRKANGHYIKIMFSDDWLTGKQSLSKFVELLDNNPETDFAFCGSRNVSFEGSWEHSITIEQIKQIKANPKFLFLGNYIGAPSATLFRNKGYEFDLKLKWLVDLELYIRIISLNNNFCYTTEPLVSIGIHNDQLTKKCENSCIVNTNEYKYVFEKFDLKNNNRCKEYFLDRLISNRNAISEIKKYNFSYSKIIGRQLQLNFQNYLCYPIKRVFCKLFRLLFSKEII